MAIRIANIKYMGKRLMQERVIEVAEKVRDFMKAEGLECNVMISNIYSDRWYEINDVKKLIEKKREMDKEEREKLLQWKKDFWEGKNDDLLCAEKEKYKAYNWVTAEYLIKGHLGKFCGRKEIERAKEICGERR